MSYQDACALCYQATVCDGGPSLAIAFLAGLDDADGEGATWATIITDVNRGTLGIPSFDA